jgi:tRNA A64-2'-O-ribosylphosphate transferase
LLRAKRWDLEPLLKELVGSSGDNERVYDHSAIVRAGGRIMIGHVSELLSVFAAEETIKMHTTAYLVISAQMHQDITSATKAVPDEAILHCHLPAGKRGQAKLVNSVLPHSIPFIDSHLARGNVVWICCDTGKDVSVGVALAALQLLFDDAGAYVPIGKRSTYVATNSDPS